MGEEEGELPPRAVHVAGLVLPFGVRFGCSGEGGMLRSLGMRTVVKGVEVIRELGRLSLRPDHWGGVSVAGLDGLYGWLGKWWPHADKE